MSPRQARRERRAAERKERKAEIKRIKAAGRVTEPYGFVSQTGSEPRPEPRVVSHAGSTRAEINRANAQHSTGPRSEAGKLASSRNSLKHGLASGTRIIPDEDPAAFEALQTALLEEHQPVTETEILLVVEMAQSWWLMQRAIRFQNACFAANEVDQKQLALFLRYQTTHERAFYKALNMLLKLTRAREHALAEAGSASQNGAARHPELGFVSQKPVLPAGKSGFVSQETALGTPSPPLIKPLHVA